MPNNTLEALRQRLAELFEQTGARKISQAELARRTGVQQATLSRFLRAEGGLSAENFLVLVEYFGGSITLEPQSSEAARSVCFVDAKLAPAGEQQAPPTAEDYMAVPLVEEISAAPGFIAHSALLAWFVVHKHQDAVRYRRDLIAVRIGKQSTSMLPTLAPRDIVLVDRNDQDVRTPGHIMAVMAPDGSGMIKRVSVEELDGGKDFRIMFYADNAANHPPMLFSLKEQYRGDWDKAIVGRVIWAWSDISER